MHRQGIVLDALQPDTNMLIWGFLMLKLKAPFKATLLCNSGKKKKGGVEIEMVREKLWWCLHESGHGEQQITAYVSERGAQAGSGGDHMHISPGPGLETVVRNAFLQPETGQLSGSPDNEN